MRETTKPNEQRKRLDADFTWEQFAKDCVLNKYALVVGPEAILNRDVNPEAEGNSKKMLFDLWSLPKGRKNPTASSISICNAKQERLFRPIITKEAPHRLTYVNNLYICQEYIRESTKTEWT